MLFHFWLLSPKLDRELILLLGQFKIKVICMENLMVCFEDNVQWVMMKVRKFKSFGNVFLNKANRSNQESWKVSHGNPWLIVIIF